MRSPTARTSAAITPGACTTILNGPKVSASVSAWPTWISRRNSAQSKIQDAGTQKSPLKICFAWDRFSSCGTGSVMRSATVRRLSLSLLLRHHQFAVFDFHITHIIRQLEPVAFLLHFFLQGRFHQRYRYVEIPNLKFRGIKRGIPVFLPQMSRDGNPHILARNLGQKLPVRDVTFHADMLVLDGGSSRANVGIRRESSTGGRSQSLGQRSADLIRIQVQFSFGCRGPAGRRRQGRGRRSRTTLRRCRVQSAVASRLLRRLLKLRDLLIERLRMGRNRRRSLRRPHRSRLPQHENDRNHRSRQRRHTDDAVKLELHGESPSIHGRRASSGVEMTEVTCGGLYFGQGQPSFFASNSFTSCGFACPFDAFITCPTKNPIMVVFPARYCSNCLGFAASTSSITFSSAEVSLDCFGLPSCSYTAEKSSPRSKERSYRSFSIFPEIAPDSTRSADVATPAIEIGECSMSSPLAFSRPISSPCTRFATRFGFFAVFAADSN